MDFEQAASFIRNPPTPLSNEQQLRLYSLFKQATVGECDAPKPGFLDFVGKAKWSAWKGLEGMTKEEAKRRYVEEVESVCPQWRETGGSEHRDVHDEIERLLEAEDTDRATAGMRFGPSVSTMCSHEDQDLAASNDLDAFDLLARGKKEELAHLLSDGSHANLRDEDGQTLLHFAADAGDLQMVKLLLQAQAEVNAASADGQTALHCACASDQLEVCKLLKANGADSLLKDVDGVLPFELATSQEIRDLLS